MSLSVQQEFFPLGDLHDLDGLASPSLLTNSERAPELEALYQEALLAFLRDASKIDLFLRIGGAISRRPRFIVEVLLNDVAATVAFADAVAKEMAQSKFQGVKQIAQAVDRALTFNFTHISDQRSASIVKVALSLAITSFLAWRFFSNPGEASAQGDSNVPIGGEDLSDIPAATDNESVFTDDLEPHDDQFKFSEPEIPKEQEVPEDPPAPEESDTPATLEDMPESSAYELLLSEFTEAGYQFPEEMAQVLSKFASYAMGKDASLSIEANAEANIRWLQTLDLYDIYVERLDALVTEVLLNKPADGEIVSPVRRAILHLADRSSTGDEVTIYLNKNGAGEQVTSASTVVQGLVFLDRMEVPHPETLPASEQLTPDELFSVKSGATPRSLGERIDVAGVIAGYNNDAFYGGEWSSYQAADWSGDKARAIADRLRAFFQRLSGRR
jgi:hypothetical protein